MYTFLHFSKSVMSCIFILLTAEFGDYDPDKHDDEFLNDYIFLPPVRTT